MITSIRHETPRARKRHICNLCGGIINPGVAYYKQTNVVDGEMETSKAHLGCCMVAEILRIETENGELTSDLFLSAVDDFLEEQGVDRKMPTAEKLATILGWSGCNPSKLEATYNPRYNPR